jgi:hypothetical protein
MRLFVEHFLLSAEDPGDSWPEPLYDETRDLNLDDEGRVFVEHVASGGTETLTEVRGEHEDRDFEDRRMTGTDTLTKVRGESSDMADFEAYPSRTHQALTGTETAVGGEPSDYLDRGGWGGTETRVRAEKEDFSRDTEERDGTFGLGNSA